MSLLRSLAVTAALAAPQYAPPVDAPVVDGFRPPASPYSAGNRGIDYDTAAGDAVRVAAPGRVLFAGRVGRGHHVVVGHDDGVRTTYAFLAAVSARRGQQLRAGDVVGIAGERLHFGARVGDAYVDPRVLFVGVRAAPARLVDDDANDTIEAGLAPPVRRFLALLDAATWPPRAAVRAPSTPERAPERPRAGRGVMLRR